MQASILGRKIGMTQVYDEQGTLSPVTVVQAGPCPVLQVKTVETDGYDAVQIGFEEAKAHRAGKPQIGHAALNPLCIALNMEDDITRGVLIDAAGSIGYKQALPYLAKVAANDKASAQVRSAASQAFLYCVV